jgi:tetratricopeptide (TPR) repeat protein
MKAEQRKRLEKNELAERLSRWWQGDDAGRTSSVLWLSVGVGVLFVLLVIAWRYYREHSAKSQAAAWKQLELASSPSDLEALIEAHKGTPVGLTAKFQLARVLLNEGLNQLASDLQRTRAVENLERARDLYRELSQEARGNNRLQREALLSAAKAEEALIGVPNAGNAEGVRGSFDQALEWYDQVASRFPDSPEGRAAGERAKSLRENREKVLSFYAELAKRFRVTDNIPKADGLGGNQGTTGGVGTGTPMVPLTPPLTSEPPPKPAEKVVPLSPPPENFKGSEPKPQATEPSPATGEKPKDVTDRPPTATPPTKSDEKADGNSKPK